MEELEVFNKLEDGDFDLRGFEVARSEFFDAQNQPYISFSEKLVKFSKACVTKFDTRSTIELLINPVEKKFAIRPTEKDNKNSVVFSRISGGKPVPKAVSTAAFRTTVYNLMGWNLDYKYRILGTLYEHGNELAYIFDAADSEVFFRSNSFPVSELEAGTGSNISIQPFLPSGKRIRAIPREWTDSFGKRHRRYSRVHIELKEPAVYTEDHDETQHPYEQAADQRDCPQRDTFKESAVLNGCDHLGRQRSCCTATFSRKQKALIISQEWIR